MSEVQTVTVTLSSSYGYVAPSLVVKALEKYVRRNEYQRKLMAERRRVGKA